MAWIDDAQPEVEQSRKKSIEFFRASWTPEWEHNAENIQKILWQTKDPEEDSESEKDQDEEWLNPKQQQQLDDYSEKLQQEQKQDQKYYNKKQPSSLDPSNPLRIIGELLGPDRELPEENNVQKDW